MATDVAVALGTSGAGLAVALASVSLSYVIARKVKREQTLDIMMRYRDPSFGQYMTSQQNPHNS